MLDLTPTQDSSYHQDDVWNSFRIWDHLYICTNATGILGGGKSQANVFEFYYSRKTPYGRDTLPLTVRFWKNKHFGNPKAGSRIEISWSCFFSSKKNDDLTKGILVGGWTNPTEKYATVKLDHESPIFGVNNCKIFELPPPRILSVSKQIGNFLLICSSLSTAQLTKGIMKSWWKIPSKCCHAIYAMDRSNPRVYREASK